MVIEDIFDLTVSFSKQRIIYLAAMPFTHVWPLALYSVSGHISLLHHYQPPPPEQSKVDIDIDIDNDDGDDDGGHLLLTVFVGN